MMRIAMLAAGFAAGLMCCAAASAQQRGDTLAGAEEGANRMVKQVDLVLPARDGTQPPAADPATLHRAWLIAPEDKTLQSTLAGWSAVAGWQFQWDLPVDYPIEFRRSVSGTFEEAVTTVTNAMDKAEVPMKAIFYMGNKVLRIVAKGGE
jgi:hypothetical protein